MRGLPVCVYTGSQRSGGRASGLSRDKRSDRGRIDQQGAEARIGAVLGAGAFLVLVALVWKRG
jgi:hypothetical protein